MQSKLRKCLQEYDGVAVTILSEAMVSCRHQPDYYDELVSLCFDKTQMISDGSTWILKAEVDEGAQLSPDLIRRIVNSLDELHSWQAKLHICQSFDRFNCDPDQTDGFFNWAKELSNHPRPFLRAWSLHVQVLIGLKFEKHRQASERALYAAESDEAASVRARARKLQELVSSKR